MGSKQTSDVPSKLFPVLGSMETKKHGELACGSGPYFIETILGTMSFA